MKKMYEPFNKNQVKQHVLAKFVIQDEESVIITGVKIAATVAVGYCMLIIFWGMTL
jgi:hypothetical protein